MDKILLENIGKKFGKQQIFSGINLSVNTGDSMAIIGYNGSGKSTFLQIIAGFISPSSGSVSLFLSENKVLEDNKYKYICYSAPYLDLFDEFNAAETITFYGKFKNFINEIDPLLIPEMAELAHAKDKPLKFYSSGMKQRLKLVLAFLTDSPFLLLDEPISNLDKPGIDWYRRLVAQYAKEKIILISSNEIKDEMDFCKTILRIEDYKPSGS